MTTNDGRADLITVTLFGTYCLTRLGLENALEGSKLEKDTMKSQPQTLSHVKSHAMKLGFAIAPSRNFQSSKNRIQGY